MRAFRLQLSRLDYRFQRLCSKKAIRADIGVERDALLVHGRAAGTLNQLFGTVGSLLNFRMSWLGLGPKTLPNLNTHESGSSLHPDWPTGSFDCPQTYPSMTEGMMNPNQKDPYNACSCLGWAVSVACSRSRSYCSSPSSEVLDR